MNETTPIRPKPLASLSLDLDNKWSYMKTHGDPGWESLPSYLEIVVPRVLTLLQEESLTITFFIVGLDAAQPASQAVLKSIAEAGHEIGNHSYKHEPWLHLYSDAELEQEMTLAETAIQQATGQTPIGFRGPGFSFSPQLLSLLARRGYQYDASTFPTFLGPLARMYYFAKSSLSSEQSSQRKALFGSAKEGFRPLKPYRWQTASGPLTEIPVTTMPLARLPIHLSYVLYLATFSRALALAYWNMSLTLCRLTNTQPSLLLHPLDFLGQEDCPELSFFPAMQTPAAPKLEVTRKVLQALHRRFQVVPMREHAHTLLSAPTKPM
jgi:peptidoglycan/xylan/chitin deacetylase (PgdA/CDA1 family)